MGIACDGEGMGPMESNVDQRVERGDETSRYRV